MNRKRRLVKGDIDSERAKVEQSDIYRAGCHELIGPGKFSLLFFRELFEHYLSC